MQIPTEELKFNLGFKTYKYGYRIVYFYEDRHEILKHVCPRKIENLAKYCGLGKQKETVSNSEILEKYLELNPKALAVAIYEIKTGKEIERKYQKNFAEEITDYVMFREELMYDYGVDHFIDGYRIVYFDSDGKYSIGTYSYKIERFMVEFCEREPIDDESEIPPFISVEDILDRYLNSLPKFEAVALYKTDGTCVLKKSRENLKTL